MKKTAKKVLTATELRKDAESIVASQPPGEYEQFAAVDAKVLLHELQVRQVELEIQNQELLLTYAELEAQQTQFLEVINETSAGYFEIDAAGCFRNVNDAWLRMHGYDSRNEVIGRHFSFTQVDSDMAQAEMNVTNLLNGQPIPSGEFSRRCKDGSIGYHIFAAHPMLQRGKVVGLRGFLIDITEHKRMDALQQARARLLQFCTDHSLDEILEETLNEAEKLTGSAIGFYHFVDADQQSLTLQNWSTRTKKEFCKADGKGSHYAISKAGVWVDCVHQGKPVIHNNYASLAHKKGLPPGHAEVVRELVVPVKRGDTIMAILGVGNKQCDYNEQDVYFASLFADLAWDSAERKRAEQLYIDSNERLKQILAEANAGFWEWDLETNKNIWSEGIWNLYGLSPLGNTPSYELWLQSVHPADREQIHAIVQDAARCGEVLNVEWRMNNPDGQERWLISRGEPGHDSAGHVIRYSGIVFDITRRKTDEINLEVTKEKYRSLFQNMPSGFALHEIILDEAGRPSDYRFLEVNPAFEALTGLVSADLIGKACREVLPKLEPFWLDIYGKVALTGESTHFESYNGDLDKYFHVTAYSPEPLKFATIFRDISDRKRIEAEKSSLEKQLVQAQKLESVGRLAGGVAHDFNNMLSVIIGHAELALMKVQPSETYHDDLLQICAAARRSADLTRQLLAFARKQTIEPKVLNLNEVLTGMLKMLARLIGENIQLVWQPGADLWPVKVDPSQIDQILANLCVNARDAIANVGILIISTSNQTLDEAWCADHPDAVPGDFVQICVKDNGCGMDQAVVEQIFEPFFTTKEIGKGTGLGLAVIYGAIKQNNGYITVDSKPEDGTTFRIFFPRHQTAAEIVPTDRIAHTLSGGSETILLVEDEPTILEMMSQMLQMQGYTVLAAKSPKEALCLAQEHEGEIRLLVTDVVMPLMNGRDLAEKMLLQQPQLKCLFMSGYTADIISTHGIIAEGTEFIQKPFAAEALLSKIGEILNGKKDLN